MPVSGPENTSWIRPRRHRLAALALVSGMASLVVLAGAAAPASAAAVTGRNAPSGKACEKIEG